MVRRIFQMTMDGMGVHSICGILAGEKIERPSNYRASNSNKPRKDYDDNEPYTWGTATIGVILKNPEYCGHTVNFRSYSTNFKSKKRKKNAPENWLVFPNTHEAIVSQEDFDTVQKLRETPRRIDTLGEANPLTGLLWCKDCGEKLYNHRKAHGEKPNHKPTDVYCCKTYKLSNSKFNTKCSPHHISTEAVRDIILTAIRTTAGYVRDYEQEFVKILRESSAIRQGETAKTYQKQIAKNERRLAEIDRIYKSLYEDKALNKIDEDMFNQLSGGYQQEKVDIRAKTEAMQAELDEFNNDSEKADKFVEIVRRYTNFEELTTPMLNSFIEKVIVYEGEWSEGNTGVGGKPRGRRTQQVDVYLKYIGSFEVPETRTPEQIETDRIAEEKLEANRTYHRLKMRQWAERKRAADVPEAAAVVDKETAEPDPAA